MAYVKCLMNVVSSTLPDGKTVTPTDDVSILLACAGRTETYTTISALLADATALAGVISSNNAIDYLVRSTTFASDVCADQGAMADIGASNYASNTLLADSTWCSAICNSTYFESVLNVKVPIMTSNTTPSGECFGTSQWGGAIENYYNAFDGNDRTHWASANNNTTNQRCAYHFTTPVKIKCFRLKNDMISTTIGFLAKNYKIQGSNDRFASNINDLYTGIQPQTSLYDTGIIVINNDTAYNDYCIFAIDNYGQAYISGVATLQFYGRADV